MFFLLLTIVYSTTPIFPPIDPASLQVINANITVYIPWQYCLPENCPSTLGQCNYTSNTCEFFAPYNGIATYPKAYVTNYCTLEPNGCLGVTYINPPYTTASYIAGNWSLPICQDMGSPQTCVGIFASPSTMNGNAQTALYVNNGTPVTNWGLGLVEASGVCYELTGPYGDKVIIGQTDRCGGYCTCDDQPVQAECGPCVNSPNLTPNCPCVGSVEPLYDDCCGLPLYSCPTLNVECDWCASQSHPHFDLDIATFNYVCGADAIRGSCEMTNVVPFNCYEPLPWPPSGSLTCGENAYNCAGGGNDPVHQPNIPNCTGCCCNWDFHPSSSDCSCSSTIAPTVSPSNNVPTKAPTKAPTNAPTTLSPTKSPTATSPTNTPTKAPTKAPTKSPTTTPTVTPSKGPTKAPTKSPTLAPSKGPTKSPTKAPTKSPTKTPTNVPTKVPTEFGAPTESPTITTNNNVTGAIVSISIGAALTIGVIAMVMYLWSSSSKVSGIMTNQRFK